MKIFIKQNKIHLILLFLSTIFVSVTVSHLMYNLITATIPGIKDFSEFPTVVAQLKQSLISNLIMETLLTLLYVLSTILVIKHIIKATKYGFKTSLEPINIKNANKKQKTILIILIAISIILLAFSLYSIFFFVKITLPYLSISSLDATTLMALLFTDFCFATIWYFFVLVVIYGILNYNAIKI